MNVNCKVRNILKFLKTTTIKSNSEGYWTLKLVMGKCISFFKTKIFQSKVLKAIMTECSVQLGSNLEARFTYTCTNHDFGLYQLLLKLKISWKIVLENAIQDFLNLALKI